MTNEVMNVTKTTTQEIAKEVATKKKMRELVLDIFLYFIK